MISAIRVFPNIEAWKGRHKHLALSCDGRCAVPQSDILHCFITVTKISPISPAKMGVF